MLQDFKNIFWQSSKQSHTDGRKNNLKYQSGKFVNIAKLYNNTLVAKFGDGSFGASQ